MQYGICGSPEIATAAAQAGYAFIECTVGALLRPRDDASAFEAALQQVRAAALPCPVVNCFVPGDLKITGPAADLRSLREYVATAFRRAHRAGVEVVVFGSGGARRIPEGFDRRQAHDQLVAFCRMMAPLAQEQGVTVVVEPLNRAECNVLTTVQECADLVREVDHPAVRLLVDGYHLLKDGDRLDAIVANADLLRHVHLATIPTRVFPGAEPCDLGPFFQALTRAGYTGRVSIEARIQDPATDFPRCLTLLHQLEAEAHRSS